jgi:cyclopropane fatty-acyl-phospholipid synthase-like methyltransferase
MKKITSTTYDAHVMDQGVDFQIRNYYEPSEVSEKRRIAIILDHLDPRRGEKVLDIGCGVGTFVFHSAKRGADGLGVDYSKESVKMAKQLVGRYAMEGSADFVEAEALHLPFKDATFNKITAVDFIEHIRSDEKDSFLSEVRRVLKDNGTAVIFTPNKIREDIGAFYWEARHLLFGHKIQKNELHYGLINKADFEKLLKKNGFVFDFYYYDTTRPYLAMWPLLKHWLSLNLLWVIRKENRA